MKKLSFTLQVEMDVPDEWEIVDDEGDDVLKIGESEYMQMTWLPLLTDDLNSWCESSDDDFTNTLINRATVEDVTMTLEPK